LSYEGKYRKVLDKKRFTPFVGLDKKASKKLSCIEQILNEKTAFVN